MALVAGAVPFSGRRDGGQAIGVGAGMIDTPLGSDLLFFLALLEVAAVKRADIRAATAAFAALSRLSYDSALVK